MILYKVEISCATTSANGRSYIEKDHSAIFTTEQSAFSAYRRLVDEVSNEYTTDASYDDCSEFEVALYKGEQAEHYDAENATLFCDEFYWTQIESKSIMNPIYREV